MNAASRIFRLFFGVILVFCGLGGIWNNYKFLTTGLANVPYACETPRESNGARDSEVIADHELF
jgi:hypothetical protein